MAQEPHKKKPSHTYWPSKKRGNKAHHIAVQSRRSQSSGKSKGIVATPLGKYMCRRNRSWKHPDYGRIMESLGERGKIKAAK